MRVDRINSRLKYLKELIEKECTGTPGELASKLDISERMLYNYLDHLKQTGLQFYFSRQCQSYRIAKDLLDTETKLQ